MNRTTKIVAAILTAAALCSAAAALAAPQEADVFAAASAYTGDHAGYIFETDAPLDPETIEDAGFTRIHDTIYQADTIEEIRTVLDEDSIVTVEPDYIFYLDDLDESVHITAYGDGDGGTAFPNDPLYPDQWHLDYMGAEAVWDAGLSAEGVRIGIIDTGLNPHEDIDETYVEQGHNFIAYHLNSPDDLPDGMTWEEYTEYTADEYGHGTCVTGVIAATTNNALGGASVGYGATIIPLKAYGQHYGSYGAYVQAIYAAVDDYHCDVLHIGLNSYENTLIESAVQYAYEHNVLMVAPVGNDGDTTPMYSGGYDQVIGVGALDTDGVINDYSHRYGVFVAVPGNNILCPMAYNWDAYAKVEGTSVSAPNVTAIVAVARAYDPDLTLEGLKALLISSATHPDGEGAFDEAYGHGIVSYAQIVEDLTTTYSVTVTAGAHGTAEAALDEAHLGKKVKLLAVPDEGYQLDGWEVISGEVTPEADHFIMPGGDVELRAVFAEAPPDTDDTDGTDDTGGTGGSGGNGGGGGGGSEQEEAPETPEEPEEPEETGEPEEPEQPETPDPAPEATPSTTTPPEGWVSPYGDVVEGSWYYAAVAWATELGLFNGTSADTFEPDLTADRAMLVTAVHRLAGTPSAAPPAFTDVPAGKYYTDAVGWAAASGIVEGDGTGRFLPGDDVTREQMVKIIWGYAAQTGLDVSSNASLSAFSDGDDVAGWAEEAMAWAVETGVITGRPDGSLDPKGNATRAEQCTVLVRLAAYLQSAE